MATEAKTSMRTAILQVDSRNLGRTTAVRTGLDVLDELDFKLDQGSADARHILYAADQLRTSDVPVAFPTETVYGLGADATRSKAVRGIYKAKQRPIDNPLIVHFASLRQLRAVMRPNARGDLNGGHGDDVENGYDDPIPEIYKPLIQRFWPGPLTILLPNPPDSPMAPEVTAGLATFGARIPRHILALALIQIADRPIAAPSANASTKPSPTAAEHVAHDLDGRIETIIDGGPCDVGVESTVVDGLTSPPLILRPGGISLEQLRACPGWEGTEVGYKDTSEKGSKPKAPGMKYRHYSPKATVVLFEAGTKLPTFKDMVEQVRTDGKIGVVRTRQWLLNPNDASAVLKGRASSVTNSTPTNGTSVNGTSASESTDQAYGGFAGMLQAARAEARVKSGIKSYHLLHNNSWLDLLDIDLGARTDGIARGIFSALRDLDGQNVDAIFVEGIDESEGDVAAAVMNRLRKAAEIKVHD